MAGNYPDYPSYRLPYDKDGTQATYVDGVNAVFSLTSTHIHNLNNESDLDGLGYAALGTMGSASKLCFIFPRKMDIDGYFFADDDSLATRLTPLTLQGSTDTTNGLDGSWSTIVNPFVRGEPTNPNYRAAVQSVTSLGLRGVRFNFSLGPNANFNNILSVHLFGEPSPGENTDRLCLWHPTLDQRVGPAYFDWGNVPRGSSQDITFRVKNLSSTLTAQAPRVAMDVLTDTTPSVPGWHLISKGSGFAAQQTIGDLGPGAISSETLTLRRTTPTNAVLSLWAFRVFAESTTWV